ncbi:MAG: D-2-hydroxyacid dehydrogenase [Verrucomicrobiales bacterium]|nr:D-2-hydroxyacid dehydrogenase [Verrucomicrobiales bacterium]
MNPTPPSRLRPQIVVLDGYTMNPGDLSWEGLEALGEVVVHPRTPAARLIERARDAEVLLTNKVVLDRAALEQLPRVRYIGVTATGYNVVDLQAAGERGIVVTNVPAYSTAAVVQLTFALLFELTHQVGHHAGAVRDGRWATCPDFSFTDFPLLELDGKRFGIVGHGNIGRAVARVASALGMSVLVHTRTPAADTHFPARFVGLPELLRESDVVSLHCPLTAQTAGLINRERLGWMKRGALLLNTGRGPLLDEAAVAEALVSGQLGGAGLDVLGSEPPAVDNPLLRAPNCFITPHLGWATTAARTRLMSVAVENLRAFLGGRPANVVTA